MRAPLWLMLLSCGDFDYAAHVPPLSGECSRVAVAEYTAPADGCIRLEQTNGKALFKLSNSESCGGAPCIRIRSGETGYVLESAKFGERATWSEWRGPCDEAAECCADYAPCGGFCCW